MDMRLLFIQKYNGEQGSECDRLKRSFESVLPLDMPEPPIVFVVDDDAAIRDSLESLLRSAGLRVRAHASCESFLASEDLAGTGCLILDVDMPGMTGPELQRELRSRACRIPVIFITAHRDERLRERVLADGAVAFFPKPFDEDRLLDEINAAGRLV